MSLFSRNNASVDKPRDTYRPLLWENLLRDYQHPHKSQQHKCDLPKTNLSKPHLAKRSSDEPKRIVDLNKKMKILRVRSKEEEANKENMQDNGNTYCYESSSSVRSEHSDILKSIELGKADKSVKYLDIQEFMCEDRSQQQQQQLKSQQKLEIQSIKEKSQNSMECQVFNLGCSNQASFSQHKNSQIIDDLPGVIQPIRHLSKCQIMLERKCSTASRMEQGKIIQQEKMEQYQINGPIEQQLHQDDADKKDQLGQQQNQESFDEQVPQIKTKLSLRILKKKLKNHSIQQVAQYVADHRRIVLDGCISQPKKKTICQAIVSYIKHQLIG